MIDLLLIHGMVITMDEHRRVLQDGAVAVDKTRILEVGETETLVKKYEAKRLLDRLLPAHMEWELTVL